MGLVLAVDGPGGAGKGTVCHIASKILGYPYLDTGLLYRAVALKLVTKNVTNKEPRNRICRDLETRRFE